MTRKLALIGLAGLALASTAEAQTLSQFALRDGGFKYAESGITGASIRTGTGGGTANFGLTGTNTAAGNTTVISTTDYLFQNWWWYRSAGDTREFALSNQTAGIQLTGNSAFLRYVEPIGGSGTANGTLTFELTYTLNQISPTQAAVTINWNITNNSQTSQPVSFFGYGDSDIGTATGNAAQYLSASGVNYFYNQESTTLNSRFFTMGADLRTNDAWQMGDGFATGRFGLTNATVTNLSNTINPFTGDFAGGFQWDLVIPAGESLGGRLTKGYNYVVPTPGAMALLGLGGLIAGRRRRA